MQRTLAIILLLLVPLRVLAAESVGLCMLQSAHAKAQAEAAMPDDCPMMNGQTEGAKHSQHGNSGCESCQLCMPLAAPDGSAAIAIVALPSAAPDIQPVHFRSADIPQALKPPTA